jgi:hypothetical protein
MNEAEERKAFEAWERAFTAPYVLEGKALLWEAWKARAALAPTVKNTPTVKEIRDWCTDPDNCKRCKAPNWDQLKHDHAGIPLGQQRTAAPTVQDEPRNDL